MKGLFELQDFGSQEIGGFCEARPGDYIIDACAGAGGKSLQLAAAINNKGKIISMDVADYKLGRLKQRAKRAGVHCIETKVIDGDLVIDGLTGKADLLLLDVPCSGTGVIKRNPDTKWKFTEKSLQDTIKLQEELLSKYSKMVKKGGKLVYSTCSIFPSENQNQITTFIQNHPGYEYIKERTIYPSEGFDGFYMCMLKKIN